MQNTRDIQRLEADLRRLRTEVDAIRFKAAS
jgi:hypothetical protein